MSLSLEDISELAFNGVTGALDLPAATLVKVTPGTRTVGDLAGGTNPTTASYTTVAIPEKRTERDWTGTAWAMTRREKGLITIMGHPLTQAGVKPEAGDRLATGGYTFEITAVDEGPGGATYGLTVTGA